MGSNGQTYMFLGKPKDDLRKDARLMDFNAMLNKLLKGNSDARRRQLRKRESQRIFAAFNAIVARYKDIRCRDTQRRMWLYSMGSKYHAPSSGPV